MIFVKYFADFRAFFWRLGTLTHFIAVASFDVATLYRRNYEISYFIPVCDGADLKNKL